jgi:hypothetical protein
MARYKLLNGALIDGLFREAGTELTGIDDRRIADWEEAGLIERVKDEESVSLSSLNKDELIAEAERRGVDSSSTKAEILERLQE